jgi:L-fucose isomerase-like protein
MAKLGAVVDHWMKETEVVMSAVQCWTAIEEYFGVVPCTVMSMMSNDLLPSACEVDICGVVGMYALQMASGTPSALLDWNNNYGEDPDKAVCFHCSNLPKHFFADVRMDFQEIIAGTVGKLNTFGTCVGRVKAGPMSFCRVSTDDRTGQAAFLRRGRRIHQRSARYLRRRRRSAHPAPAGPAALYLPERLGASRGREFFYRGGDGARSRRAVPRLGHALA